MKQINIEDITGRLHSVKLASVSKLTLDKALYAVIRLGYFRTILKYEVWVDGEIVYEGLSLEDAVAIYNIA